MDEFGLYFTLGRQHIADWNGIDHLLFIAALVIRYQFTDWKKVVILITAFTIGHSVTLALSVFKVIHLSTRWIEFIIPVTILITAASNAFIKKFTYRDKYPFIYFVALLFGLIHGLGFSNYLRSILGRNQNIFVELFAFNIGLEAGQLLIVFIVLLITFICLNVIKFNRREFILFATGGIFLLALEMALHRTPF